eukprot:g4506.t1
MRPSVHEGAEIFCGYAKKKAGGVRLGKKWQARYFVLAGHYLRYYADARRARLKGVIDVRALRSCTPGTHDGTRRARTMAACELVVTVATGGSKDEDEGEDRKSGLGEGQAEDEDEGKDQRQSGRAGGRRAAQVRLRLRLGSAQTRARWGAALLPFVDAEAQAVAEKALKVTVPGVVDGSAGEMQQQAFQIAVQRRTGADGAGLGMTLGHADPLEDPQSLAPVYVQEVFDGGAAEEAVAAEGGERIEPGDELTHVGGVALRGLPFDEVLALLKPDRVELRLVRLVPVDEAEEDEEDEEDGGGECSAEDGPNGDGHAYVVSVGEEATAVEQGLSDLMSGAASSARHVTGQLNKRAAATPVAPAAPAAATAPAPMVGMAAPADTEVTTIAVATSSDGPAFYEKQRGNMPLRPSVHEGDMVIEGFAKKRRAIPLLLQASWQRRYFVVQGHYLRYYSDASRERLRGAIDLRALRTCTRGCVAPSNRKGLRELRLRFEKALKAPRKPKPRPVATAPTPKKESARRAEAEAQDQAQVQADAEANEAAARGGGDRDVDDEDKAHNGNRRAGLSRAGSSFRMTSQGSFRLAAAPASDGGAAEDGRAPRLHEIVLRMDTAEERARWCVAFEPWLDAAQQAAALAELDALEKRYRRRSPEPRHGSRLQAYELCLSRDAEGNMGLLLDQARAEGDKHGGDHSAPLCVDEVFEGGVAAAAVAEGGERIEPGDELTHVGGVALRGLPFDEVLALLKPDRVELRLHLHQDLYQDLHQLTEELEAERSVCAGLNAALAAERRGRTQAVRRREEAEARAVQAERESGAALAAADSLRAELGALRARVAEQARALVLAQEQAERGRVCEQERGRHAASAERAAAGRRARELRRCLHRMRHGRLLQAWNAWAAGVRLARENEARCEAVEEAVAAAAAAERIHALGTARRDAARRVMRRALLRRTGAAWRTWRAACAARGTAQAAVLRYWRRQRPRRLGRALALWRRATVAALSTEGAASRSRALGQQLETTQRRHEHAEQLLSERLEHAYAERAALEEKLTWKAWVAQRRQQQQASKAARHKLGRPRPLHDAATGGLRTSGRV